MQLKRFKLYFTSVLFIFIVTLILSFGINAYAASATPEDANSSLGFIFNSETQEYKVKALNKTLTEAVIPSTYKGYPVTAIEDNGFTNCTALERVIIPRTIKTIGNNAFMRCTNLKKVMGLSGVETVGNNAFSRCTNLDYFILPQGIQSIGSSLLYNADCTVYSRMDETKLNAVSSTWSSGFNGNVVYGNELVYEKYINEYGEEGVSLVSWQNINIDENTTLIIDSWIVDNTHTGEDKIEGKLLKIADSAFADCAAHHLIIKYPDNIETRHTIDVESYAFAFSYIDNISISVDISFADDSEGQFSNSEFKTISLPNSITAIPKQAFSDCYELVELKFDGQEKPNILSNKITRIEHAAFSSCYKLPEITISENIEYIGQAAFGFWGNEIEQNIYINLLEEGANWNPDWNDAIIAERCTIEFIAVEQYTIALIVEQEGVLGATGNATLYVQPRTTLNEYKIENPTATSHDFTGIWYTSAERKSGTEFSFDTPIRSNQILYAGWSRKIIDISFDVNRVLNFMSADGNILSGQTLSVGYGELIQFTYKLIDGYIDPVIRYGSTPLNGNENGDYFVTAVYDGHVSVSQYQLINYSISYICNSFTNNPASNPTEYTVEDLPLNIQAPTWEAYVSGTWDVKMQPSGQQITDSMTVPKGAYGNIEFSASWSNPKKYRIFFNYGVGADYIESIQTSYEDFIEFDIETPTFSLDTPTWEPYLECEWDIPVISQGTWRDITVTAVWRNPRNYFISYLNLRGGNKGANNGDTYTIEDLPLSLDNPIWDEAYESGTWEIPSITIGSLRNITVLAQWSNPVLYAITYANLRLGTIGANNSNTYTVEDLPLRLDNPTWTAAYNSGIWSIPSVTETTLRDITVTAQWSNPVSYAITYANLRLGTKGANNSNTYTVENLPLRLDYPTWASAYNSGTWLIPSVTETTLRDITVTAQWSNPVPYEITYTNLRFGIKGTNNSSTYTIENLPLRLDNPTWKEAYNSGIWSVPSVTETTLRDITVTAQWSNPVPYQITYANLRAGIKGANNSSTYTVENLPLRLDNPTWKAAYNTGIWSIPNVTEKTLRDITVTAQWSNPKQYAITYENLHGGTKGANNKNTYTADDLIGKTTLELDDPTWPGVYKSGKWILDKVINDFNLGRVTATADWEEPINRTINYIAPPDTVYYYNLEELQYSYSEAPRLQTNECKNEYNYEIEVIFDYFPGKPGYIGEWLINGVVADRVPLNTVGDVTVTCRWKPITYEVLVFYVDGQKWDPTRDNFDSNIKDMEQYTVAYNEVLHLYNKEIEGYYFYQWNVNCYESHTDEHPMQTYTDYNIDVVNLRDFAGSHTCIAAVYMPDACIANGTMITLADGSQKAVEELVGDEMLLTWNMLTGTFDVAPILFIDKDPAREYNVINLSFSDGTEVGVISEHGFWDFNLSKYVYLDKNAAQYVGHWFNKQALDEKGQLIWKKVQLVDVNITQEYTTAWSPVTYSHLCYYVNGMLSMPGGISGLFNIFDVDPETMTINAEAMAQDIEIYGLFTYEEFAELVPVSNEVFNAFNGQYLKVAIGKGMITIEQLQNLVARYAVYFESIS